jgi:hypothetical protein
MQTNIIDLRNNSSRKRGTKVGEFILNSWFLQLKFV